MSKYSRSSKIDENDMSTWTLEQRQLFIAAWNVRVESNGGKVPEDASLGERNIATQLGLIPVSSMTVEVVCDDKKYRGTLYLVEVKST